MRSYAQVQEDLILYCALRDVRRGFYIDVGAHHPVALSVTKLFHDLGWRGLNIEPVQHWFDMLVKHRPGDINLRLCAGASSGETVLHEVPETGLSTVVARHVERHRQNGFAFRSYSVPTRRLDDVCAEHVAGEIHFLKVDVEGAEPAVLEGCDFGRYRPWIVTIEALEPLSEAPAYMACEKILNGSDYEFCADDGLNRYYVSREHSELKRPLRIASRTRRIAGPFIDVVRRHWPGKSHDQ